MCILNDMYIVLSETLIVMSESASIFTMYRFIYVPESKRTYNLNRDIDLKLSNEIVFLLISIKY